MTQWYQIGRGSFFSPTIQEVDVVKVSGTMIWIGEPCHMEGQPDRVTRCKIHSDYTSHYPTFDEALQELKKRAEFKLRSVKLDAQQLEYFLDKVEAGEVKPRLPRRTHIVKAGTHIET